MTTDLDPANHVGRFAQPGDPPWLVGLCRVATGLHASEAFESHAKLAEAIRFVVVHYRVATRMEQEAREDAESVRRQARKSMDEACQAVAAVEQRNRNLWSRA